MRRVILIALEPDRNGKTEFPPHSIGVPQKGRFTTVTDKAGNQINSEKSFKINV
jgi:hypothetical protein